MGCAQSAEDDATGIVPSAGNAVAPADAIRDELSGEDDPDCVDEDEADLSDLEFDADGNPSGSGDPDGDGEEGLFSIEDTSKDVDNFMAIKPWIGALVAPSSWLAAQASGLMPAPQRSLALKWAHGYRCREARHNVAVLATDEVVWPAAAVGVIYDEKAHAQRHYQGHCDDILCLAVSEDRSLVATGGIASKAADGGRCPEIQVWRAADGKEACPEIKGFHKRSIAALTFSGNGRLLFSAGGDNDHCVAVHRCGSHSFTAGAHSFTKATEASRQPPPLLQCALTFSCVSSPSRVFACLRVLLCPCWPSRSTADGALQSSQKSGPDELFDCAWDPASDRIAVVGVK